MRIVSFRKPQERERGKRNGATGTRTGTGKRTVAGRRNGIRAREIEQHEKERERGKGATEQVREVRGNRDARGRREQERAETGLVKLGADFNKNRNLPQNQM
ncbi:TPA: hypothetical protein DDW35_06750 [Candidatus Sumerlaeota bacterium]|nr:hypothetical protein [Candidatus Sumerlaeota bacterium]